jgi:hypothetical protein
MIQYFPIVTGSLTVLGNINVSGSITTSGSITISGSITSASFATSASNATNAISASYANNLTVAGTLTAQTIVVQTITSSVDFVTGSTRFGSLSSDTMKITGSVSISGSSTALNVNSGAFFISSSGNVGIGTINPSTRLTISKPIDFTAYGSGSQAIDFKVYYPGYDLDTVKASIYVGISSIASLNTQSGYMSFMTSNAGTLAERMRIEKDGTIGIGTTIPSAFIDIRKNVFTPTSTAASVLIEERGTYQMGMEFYIHNAGTYLAGRPSGGVGTCNTAALRIAGGGLINGNFTGGGGVTFMPSTTIGSVLAVGDSDGFIFYTTGSLTAGTGINLANNEVMRITNKGYTKMTNSGTYNSVTGIYHEMVQSVNNYQSATISHIGSSPYGLELAFTGADPNNATNWGLGFYATTPSFVWIYRIYSNGTVGARSDARWKKNIETTRNGYLEDLCKLRVVKYNWYNNEENAPKELGLIAQEVEEVFPNLVSYDKVTTKKQVKQEDGNFIEQDVEDGVSRSIKISVLQFMLLKGLQEANTKIQELNTKFEEYKATHP